MALRTLSKTLSNILIAALTTFVVFDLEASEKDVAKWSEIGWWEILVDRSLDSGCFAWAEYDGGTILRIGFDPTTEMMYFMIANSDWKSVEIGKDYNLDIQFDDEDPWKAESTAIDMGIAALHVETRQWDFVDEFKRKHTLFVSYKDQNIATLSLKGSARAIDEVVRCQSAMMDTTGASLASDPFKSDSKTATPKDPFAD